MRRFATLSLTAIGLWVAPPNAQLPVRMLEGPDATLSRPFDRITGLYELRDGRVIVVDANEQSVLLIDFTSDRAVQLGRQGAGPGEYRFPGLDIGYPRRLPSGKRTRSQ